MSHNLVYISMSQQFRFRALLCEALAATTSSKAKFDDLYSFMLDTCHKFDIDKSCITKNEVSRHLQALRAEEYLEVQGRRWTVSSVLPDRVKQFLKLR